MVAGVDPQGKVVEAAVVENMVHYYSANHMETSCVVAVEVIAEIEEDNRDMVDLHLEEQIHLNPSVQHRPDNPFVSFDLDEEVAYAYH
jgi:hypothetical protein